MVACLQRGKNAANDKPEIEVPKKKKGALQARPKARECKSVYISGFCLRRPAAASLISSLVVSSGAPLYLSFSLRALFYFHVLFYFTGEEEGSRGSRREERGRFGARFQAGLLSLSSRRQ